MDAPSLSFLREATKASLTSELVVENGELRTRQRLRPLQCVLRIFGAPTTAKVIARSEGACFFFHTVIGALPFTAEGGVALRQTLAEAIQRLQRDPDFITRDIDLRFDDKGLLHLHGSMVTETAATLPVFLTVMAEYAQAARPYLLELRPQLTAV